MATSPDRIRTRILETLDLIGDEAGQVTYQLGKPSVNVSTELFNQWDDWYRPDDKLFRAAFDSVEREIIEQFNRIFEDVSTSTPKQLPSVLEFQKTEAWRRLHNGATDALLALRNHDSRASV